MQTTSTALWYYHMMRITRKVEKVSNPRLVDKMQRIRVHPGEILLEEFLLPMKTNPTDFAKTIGVPEIYILDIVRGKKHIDVEAAYLLSNALGTREQWWINLHRGYDISVAKAKKSKKG